MIVVFSDHTPLLFLNRLVIVSSSEDHFEESVSEEIKSSFFEAFVKVWECHSQINQSDTRIVGPLY